VPRPLTCRRAAAAATPHACRSRSPVPTPRAARRSRSPSTRGQLAHAGPPTPADGGGEEEEEEGEEARRKRGGGGGSFLFFLLSCRHRQLAMASNGSSSTVSPATPLLSPDRARYRPTLAGSFAFPYDLSWDLTGSCWEFLLLLALASSGPQVVGEMQSSLDRVRRQLSSTSTRHLPPGPSLEAIRHGKSTPFISPSFWISSLVQVPCLDVNRNYCRKQLESQPVLLLLTLGYRCEPLVNICLLFTCQLSFPLICKFSSLLV